MTIRESFTRWMLNTLGLIPVSEAARRSQVETDLLALGVSEADVAELGRAVVELAKAGASSADEIADAYARGMTCGMVRVRDLQWAKHATPERIDLRITALMNGDTP